VVAEAVHSAGPLMRTRFGALLLALVSLFSPWPVSAVTIDWSPVGNPGNAPDQNYHGQGQFGAVGYAYNIGTYDVTNSQYVEFLNTKDPAGANTLGLYNGNMADATFGGINFNAGNPSGGKYTVISGAQNHPVNAVTWYDAVRFANWLDNGQGNGDTESGAYTLLGGTPTPSNANNITRNAGATIFLPSEDEWYKAAYYDPITHSYFQYPTSSNAAPIGSSPTAAVNHANIFPGGPTNLTDVGAYTGSASPYGAFDMGGNVFQWNEALISGSFRGARGGSFATTSSDLLSSHRDFQGPAVEDVLFGFRVASTPEPSTGVLALLAGSILWWCRKRFVRRDR
jgi:formylglycine-generating enzyme